MSEDCTRLYTSETPVALVSEACLLLASVPFRWCSGHAWGTGSGSVWLEFGGTNNLNST